MKRVLIIAALTVPTVFCLMIIISPAPGRWPWELAFGVLFGLLISALITG